MPAAISPVTPSAASTPPVGSSSSAKSRTKPTRAMTTKASILRLCALQRVASNVRFEFGVVGVGALLEVDELAGAVVEGGVGEAEAGAERVGDLPVGVGVAGVGERRLGEEGPGRVVGVLGVDAEEGDPFAVAGGELLQDRELEAAGPATGGPDVGDDRVSLQRGDPSFVGAGAARQQLIRLLVQGGQGRRRPRQGGRVVGALAAVVATAGGAAAAGDEGGQRQRQQAKTECRSRGHPFRDYNTYVRFAGMRAAENSGGKRYTDSREPSFTCPSRLSRAWRGRTQKPFYGQDQRCCRQRGSSFKRRYRARGGVRPRALPARRRGAGGAGARHVPPPRHGRGAEGDRGRGRVPLD